MIKLLQTQFFFLIYCYKSCIRNLFKKGLTSTRARSAIDVSDVIDSGTFGSQKPCGAVQLQGCLVTVVLYILAAIKRVRDQLLKHFSGELPILDAEGKIALDDRSDIHLGG